MLFDRVFIHFEITLVKGIICKQMTETKAKLQALMHRSLTKSNLNIFVMSLLFYLGIINTFQIIFSWLNCVVVKSIENQYQLEEILKMNDSPQASLLI